MESHLEAEVDWTEERKAKDWIQGRKGILQRGNAPPGKIGHLFATIEQSANVTPDAEKTRHTYKLPAA